LEWIAKWKCRKSETEEDGPDYDAIIARSPAQRAEIVV